MGHDPSFNRLVSLACHDMRTPLATVHGFATTLVRRHDLGDPVSRYVALIETASQQLGDLIDDISLAARIEGERYEAALDEVDTLTVARAAAEQLGDDKADATGTGGAAVGEGATLERALAALARCALRHGGVPHVTIQAQGSELVVAPVTPEAAPIVLGDELKDLGAAVAVRAIEAGGGSVEVAGDRLVVRLPARG